VALCCTSDWYDLKDTKVIESIAEKIEYNSRVKSLWHRKG
jgi:hypothetical protein